MARRSLVCLTFQKFMVGDKKVIYEKLSGEFTRVKSRFME